MAKSKAKKKRRPQAGTSAGGGAATAEADPDVEGMEREPAGDAGGGNTGNGSGPPSDPGRGDGDGPQRPSPPTARGQGGFFDLYKRGQGYYTRMGTAIGAAVLIVAGADYAYDQLGGVLPADVNWSLYVQVGVPLGLMLVLGLITYWLVGANRRSCDFMIATEGEMKKVNWSSRATVVGSTKIVIIFVVLMSALLFVVDTVFMLFFNGIGVLQVAPNVLKMFLDSGES